MLKKTLLMAATAAIATCGTITAASAGQLKLRLHDVNVNKSDDPGKTKHIDKDLSRDLNNSFGPNGTGYPTNETSVDKGFAYFPDKPDFTHVVLAEERMCTVEQPCGGFYEIDVFEVTDGATFGNAARFDIFLEGSADPMFKKDVNCVNAVRAGSDNVHSLSAQTAGGVDSQSIKAGETEANCTVTTQNGDGNLKPDRAVGWVLPIETKACGDLTVRMIVTRADPVDGSQLVDETSHTIQTCEDGIKSQFAYFPVKIDYFEDFRSFLIDPYYYDNIEYHVASLWAHSGAMQIDFHNFVVDLKADKPKTEHHSVLDLSDVESYDLVVAFDDLTGIKEVCLDNGYYANNQYYGGNVYCADLDYVEDTATWYFDQTTFGKQFCIEERTGEYKGDKDAGCKNWFTLHAFGPNYVHTNNGPIDHQIAVVVKSDINLYPAECNTPHCVKFNTPEVEGFLSQVAQLNKTGISFGPFDWSTDAGRQVVSWYRVTGIPKDIVDLKGDITLDNVSGGEEYKGTWKVDFPDGNITNHDMIISPQMIEDMLIEAGMPNGGNFGRADMTFTFYVGGDEGKKMDMDRLLRSNGTWTNYGDNGNDAFSLKARSCDAGRFGPHVANKLDPGFEYLLTGICGIGELDRYGIYYYNY